MTDAPAAAPRDVDRVTGWTEFDPADTPPDLSPALAEFLDRWRRLAAGRRAPARADFAPEDLGGHLGNVVLVDCLPAGGFRLRLIGSSIVDAAGREVTGATFQEAYAGEALDRLTRIAVSVRDGWRAVHVMARIDVPGRDFIPYTALVLPLSATGSRVDMLIMRMELYRRG